MSIKDLFNNFLNKGDDSELMNNEIKKIDDLDSLLYEDDEQVAAYYIGAYMRC